MAMQSIAMQSLRTAAKASSSTARKAGLRTAPVSVDSSWSACCSVSTSSRRHSSTRPRSRIRGSSIVSSTRQVGWCSASALKITTYGNDFYNRNNSISHALQRFFHARNFGVSRPGKRAPHVVLQVSATASKTEIKAAFRKLAKQHHPDLRVHQNQDEDDNDDIMAELITAYESLMNKHSEHFWTDARDSKVALACEMYTIEELRGMNHLFDVHSFRITFSDTLDGDTTTNNESLPKTATAKDNSSLSEGNSHHLDPTPIVPLNAHPDDSISDLKRHIQSCYAEEWGIDDRRVDRDGLYLGWELIHWSNAGDTGNDGDGNVLSYHLFLSSYDIQEGDVLHAVVRKDSL